MTNWRTKRFRQLLAALPPEVRRQARAAYRLFTHNPHHPSLHFKRVGSQEPVYSVRVGISYRALGIQTQSDEIVWFWIGSHAEYDQLVSRL